MDLSQRKKININKKYMIKKDYFNIGKKKLNKRKKLD
jgi:hypothetical protein